MARLRSNFQRGSLSANAASGDTTINAPEFAGLPVVASPDYLMIVLDPDAQHGNPEIIKVTAHTSSATSVTVVRAQEGTSARAHNSSTTWRHVATAQDWVLVGETRVNVQSDKTYDPIAADNSAAINNTIAASISSNVAVAIVVLPPGGSYGVANSITATQVTGLHIEGGGKSATVINPTTALSGAPVFLLQDCYAPTVEKLRINGNSSATTGHGIRFDVANPNVLSNTQATVRDVYFGSDSAASITNGISWTTSGPDDNNDMSRVENCTFTNLTNAFNVAHSNSEGHIWIANVFGNVTGAAVKMAGGGFRMVGGNFTTPAGSWMFDFGAGTYRRGCDIIGIHSEVGGNYVRANASAVALTLRIIGGGFEGGPATNTPFDLENTDILSSLKVDGVYFNIGQTGITWILKPESHFTDSDLDFSTLEYNNRVNLVNCRIIQSGPTYTNLGSGSIQTWFVDAGTPSVTPLAQAGVGATASVVGDDRSGYIEVNTGTGPSAGDQVALTFSEALPNHPVVIISPNDSGSAALRPYVNSTPTTGFTLSFATAPAASTSYFILYNAQSRP